MARGARAGLQRLCAAGLLAVAWSAPGAAQAPPPDPEVERLLDLENQPGYRYEGASRRDPFVSLLRPVAPAGGTRCRCGGPPGLLVSEMALRGIVKTGQGYTAMLEGPDHRSYFVKPGERFYDGFLIEVREGSLLFRQEVVDPLSPVRTRELRVALHPEP